MKHPRTATTTAIRRNAMRSARQLLRGFAHSAATQRQLKTTRGPLSREHVLALAAHLEDERRLVEALRRWRGRNLPKVIKMGGTFLVLQDVGMTCPRVTLVRNEQVPTPSFLPRVR